MLKQRSSNRSRLDQDSGEQTTEITHAQKSRRKRWLRPRNILLLVGLLLVVLGLSAFQTYRTVRAHADSGIRHFQAGVDLLKGDNISVNVESLNRLRQELDAAGTDFKLAHEGLGLYGLVLPLVGWLPGPAYDVANLANF